MSKRLLLNRTRTIHRQVIYSKITKQLTYKIDDFLSKSAYLITIKEWYLLFLSLFSLLLSCTISVFYQLFTEYTSLT